MARSDDAVRANRGREPTRARALPGWAPWIEPAVAVAIGGVALVAGGESNLDAGRIALIALAVAPWVIEAAGVPIPRLLLAAVVIGAVAAFTQSGGDDFAFMFLIFLVGGEASFVARLEVAVVTAACVAVVLSLSARYPDHQWVYWIGGIGLGLFAGSVMRVQRRLMAQLQAAQDELRRRAAAEERRRIAREVHDVIAHSLTVTMLHLTAARMALDTDPAEAREALADAERLGRQSLSDIRRAVGLLRAEGESATEAPLPSGADVEALVGGFREAGLDVGLQVQGDPAALTPAAGVAVYRIVQESLTNVGKHAPGARVEVRLDVGLQGCRVEVSDRGGLAGAAQASWDAFGLGLMGMRERAALLGGKLEAGPEGPGWTVRCTLPAGAALLRPATPTRSGL